MVGYNAGPLARIDVTKKTSNIVNVEVKKKSNGKDEGYNLQLLYDLESPTLSQLEVAKAMDSSMVVVVAGDTGVGKTLITIIEMAKWLIARKVRKVVLTSPSHISKENIIDTYRDYMVQTLGVEKLDALLTNEKIKTLTVDEINTTTLKNTLVIMDNAEFASSFELYSVISRLGKGSTLVILADLHPVLPSKKSTKGFKNLVNAIHTTDIEFDNNELSYVLFNKDEIVRSPLLNKFLNLFK